LVYIAARFSLIDPLLEAFHFSAIQCGPKKTKDARRQVVGVGGKKKPRLKSKQ
jgi:hypothetical protein